MTRTDDTSDAGLLRLEAFLPWRLNRLADAVSREFQTIYKGRYGLTRPEWRLLATLGQYRTMTATAVGSHSAMHKTKVSRAVAALEARRWLVRTADAADRRVEHLALTRAGEAIYRELVPLARSFERNLLLHLTEPDCAALLAGLAALEAGLPAPAGAAPAPEGVPRAGSRSRSK